jgi:acyl carrier protein
MSRDEASIRSTVRGYILNELVPGEAPEKLDDALSLKEAGILDSLSTLQFVSHVEEAFGIELEPHEASSSFTSVNEIVALVKAKLA